LKPYHGPVKSLSRDNFGLLIAYLLPGFVALWGVSYFSETVRSWLAMTPATAPTVGGFLYATLASTAAGLIVGAVRWFLLDRLFHRTGIPEPRWQFQTLADRLPAFEAIVEFHFRYYQFYSSMVIALAFAWAAKLVSSFGLSMNGFAAQVGLLLIGGILFAGSRDALRKYYHRAASVLDAEKRQ
jgi:hypothetical protein